MAAKTIDRQTVESAIAANALIIDVREPSETALGVIPTARLVPVGQMASALALDPAAFLQKFKFEMPLKDSPIIFYCRSGARAGRACDDAVLAGFTNVANYKGSWNDWSAQ